MLVDKKIKDEDNSFKELDYNTLLEQYEDDSEIE